MRERYFKHNKDSKYDDLERIKQIAKMLSRCSSTCPSSIKKEVYALQGDAKAKRIEDEMLGLILFGHDLGISPLQSVTGLNNIGGKLAMSAELISSLCMGHCDDYKEEITIEDDESFKQ